MDALFNAILTILNALIPSAQEATFQGLNELLAYIISVLLLYTVLVRPILRLFGVKR